MWQREHHVVLNMMTSCGKLWMEEGGEVLPGVWKGRGDVVRKSLPQHVTWTSSLPVFRARLKTHLFSLFFP